MVCTLFDHHCSPISAKNLSVIVKIYFNTSSLWTNLWTNSTSRPRRTFCSSRTLRKRGPFSVSKDSWSSSLILLKQSEVKKWQHRQCPGNYFFLSWNCWLHCYKTFMLSRANLCTATPSTQKKIGRNFLSQYIPEGRGLLYICYSSAFSLKR